MSNAFERSLETEAKNINIARYLAIATFTLVVYEYIITLDDEIILLWSTGRQTAIKLILIFNRYAPFVTSFLFLYVALLFPHDFQLCKPIAILIGFLTYTCTASSEIILILRIYVLWGGQRRILIVLLSLFMATIAIAFAVVYKAAGSFVEVGIRPYDSGCVLLLTSKLGWVPFFTFLTEEIILLLLIMAKDDDFRRTPTRRLVIVLVQDGQVYYSCMIIVTIVNLLVNSVVPNPPPFYGSVLEAVLHNIVCIRLSAHLIKVNETSASFTLSSTCVGNSRNSRL